MTQTTIEQRLKELNITLPNPPKPVASYVPARQTGSLVHISGQIPMAEGSLLATGIVPTDVDQDTATQCARQCTLNALANLQNAIGSLDRVTKVVKAGIFVAASKDFGAHPQIANGCSDLLVEIFGQEKGQHARAAIGVASLPLNVPVEIEYIFEIE
ncbi:MAG: RidA family protein [Phycisphaerales bacterium]|nr:RidA family protein [Phycisphaerales bacterium]